MKNEDYNIWDYKWWIKIIIINMRELKVKNKEYNIKDYK